MSAFMDVGLKICLVRLKIDWDSIDFCLEIKIMSHVLSSDHHWIKQTHNLT